MKFVGILLLLAALVAIQASAQDIKVNDISPGSGGNNKKSTASVGQSPYASYKCDVDDDCPRGYGCKCEEYHHVCVFCKECTSDEYCQDKYSNPETSCKCTHNLCRGCVANA